MFTEKDKVLQISNNITSIFLYEICNSTDASNSHSLVKFRSIDENLVTQVDATNAK